MDPATACRYHSSITAEPVRCRRHAYRVVRKGGRQVQIVDKNCAVLVVNKLLNLLSPGLSSYVHANVVGASFTRYLLTSVNSSK